MNNVKCEVPGNKNYYINHDNNVVDIYSGIIPVKNGSVTISLFDRVITVSMDWLLKYCECNITLPKSSLVRSKVEQIEFKDMSLESHKIHWKYIPILNPPIEVTIPSSSETFRVVPGFFQIAISKSGNVYYLDSNKLRLIDEMRDRDYPSIAVYDAVSGLSTGRLIHRLIAMAWVPNDDYVKKPIVDHKDGNKRNCHASNLEWVSFSTNNARTAQQGLRTDNISVKVMDYEKQLVTVFSSMTQACVFMNRSRINRLEEFCSKPTLINNRYQIKLLSDLSDWDFKDGCNKRDDYCVVINGDRKCYPSLKELKSVLTPELSYKKGASAVIARLKRDYGKGVIIEFPEPTKLANDTYQVLEVATGEVTEHKTRKDVVNYTGLSKTCVANYLNLGPDHAYNGYCIRVKSDVPWSNKDTTVISSITKVKVRDAFTNMEHTCSSIRKAAEYIDVNRKLIVKYLDTNQPIAGYIVSKVK